MYIQPGHGLNDFQEFQIRGKSKGGLISRFIFKGIWYWRLKIQVKFKGGLNVHKYVRFSPRLSEIRSLKKLWICPSPQIHIAWTYSKHAPIFDMYLFVLLFNHLFRSSGMNYYWTWIKSTYAFLQGFPMLLLEGF